MHGNRRRKKRPNYGVRTVEITKGHTGFGFTISGQAPCILSCIVQGSPADRAGLRPGDYLIAVNGQNVSKSPHDDVVKSIGLSILLKLQIAENYYSDSSDEEFSTRPKPKYPNRLRHKQQQTRVEKVVRDIQNGALFSDTSVMQFEEKTSTLERDWNDAYLSNDHSGNQLSSSFHNSNMDLPPTPSTSPTRLRPDQIRLVMAEARKTAHGSRTIREEAPVHPLRMRSTPKKVKQKQLPRLPTKPTPLRELDASHSQDYRHLHNTGTGELSAMLPQQFHPFSKGQLQDLTNHPHLQHPHHSLQYPMHSNDHSMTKPSPFQALSRYSNVKEKQQIYQQLAAGLQMNASHRLPSPGPEGYKPITEQDINNILYPTLAELQQKISADNMGDVIYKAVVGYLGTIEMPKEPQEASRLTAIRNCIMRLRIEKKVHTLVLMSIYPEQVILTNPHGLTLAEYPAERITFCGVYADDKKFFGLVTVHGSNAEVSEGSQDDGEEQPASVSSSCHVFMVDKSVKHVDHFGKAKNFRIECTPAPEDVTTTECLEFPDTANPILHSIIGLYKNRAGVHANGRAPGLVDVDAQVSPPHSNTSSNSSNSDSGIGFRDECNGSYQYHNAERVFVVEFDDNQRNRQQNAHIVSNLRGNNPNRSNVDNLRPNIDNLRAQMDISLANNINILPSEGSDSSLTPAYARESAQCRSTNHVSGGPYGAYASFNYRSMETDDKKASRYKNSQFSSHDGNRTTNDSHLFGTSDSDGHLRVSVSDKRKLFELRSCLADGKLSSAENRYASCDGRMSVTDDRRAARLEERALATDGRSSVTIELKTSEQLNNTNILRDCKSPIDGNRLTVRAMPDPITFERAVVGIPPETDSPAHIECMRYSMHKYLQHKQEHLVKVSQRINRRESDSGGVHPLSVRAFSPATTIQDHSQSVFKKPARKPPMTTMNLSHKLSPKVFAFPDRLSAPSERSFTRSLEDLRDSSASEGIYAAAPLTMFSSSGLAAPSGFRDVSESDHGLDCFHNAHLSRLMHASETNLSRCETSLATEPREPQQGAFRAVAQRSRRYADGTCFPTSVVPRVGRLCDVGAIGDISYLDDIGLMSHHPLDSCDDNTETTENTGGPGGSQDVHPPTQDEFSQDSDSEQVEDGKKQRGLSLKRMSRGRAVNTSESETTTHSNSDINKNITDGENSSIPPNPTVGLSRVTSWAASFEKLLEDPAGLHTFAEFLKKEFSHENIYFWTACERYKTIADANQRKDAVRKIFDRHLSSGAQDPVNIDAQARLLAQQGLSEPDEFIFAPAQKHIFMLMKFDSYTRFLKSDLYNCCLSHELKGLPLPFPGDDSLDPDLQINFSDHFTHLKKSKSDADDRRRKSLLSWTRSKDRSKSKDRGEAEYRRKKKYYGTTPSESSSMRSDITDSFTSLNSSDFIPGRRTASKESLSSCEDGFINGENKQLCRVILPDNGNSVVAVKSQLTVKYVIKQLLDRRRVNFSAFNVFYKGDKIIDLDKDSTVMGGLEVRVEQMILFSLHLPSLKTVYVKAKTHKLCNEVLKPILAKYGYKLDVMNVTKHNYAQPLPMKMSVMDLDGGKLVVTHKDETKNIAVERSSSRGYKLDEITGRIFDDLLDCKSNSNFDDLGVLDFDARSTTTDTSSNSSTGLLGNFNRRESLPMERDNLRQSISSCGQSNSLRRQNAELNSSSMQENELYEGLKRAQKSRLDDQRGTEINFELPDFLKCEQTQGAKKLTTRGDFLSEEHPEVWGGMDDSAEKTLLATDFDMDDLEETICGPADTSAAAVLPTKRHATQPHFLSPPPPPLPPKPKLGALARGPPPRPPSRTAPPHPILMDVPLKVSANRRPDKFSVSFV